MTNIHDSGYKILFSNRTIFRQLIETFVEQPWVSQLDFERAETVEKSFVSDHYKETESDLIYRLPYGDEEIYIYVLLEFQSRVEYWMVVRMLNYITNFYMDWVKAHPEAKKLPVVFPILLYNGDAQWTAATEMAAVMQPQPELGEYAIGFRYFKIAENEYSQEQLLGIQNIVSTLFLAESRLDISLLQEQLLALFERAEDKQAISLFLNWYRQLAVHGRVKEDDYTSLAEVYRSAEEVQGMLQKTFAQQQERWFQEGREEGREEGLEQGIEKGREEGAHRRAIEIAWAMYERGIDFTTIADITGLDEDEITALIETTAQDEEK
jgi:predicted transposase/invertase (TIGR01784 family)